MDKNRSQPSNENNKKKQNMKTNYAFVDFQGFKDNFNRFIVKEFAMKTKNIKFHDIIKSPSNVTLNEKYRKQANWLTENFHGIDWDSGYISLKELRNTLQPILNDKVIYIKGNEKIKWLQYILGINNNIAYTIVDLETMGCSINLSNLNTNTHDRFRACNKHPNFKNKKNPKYHCAMQNVMILGDWYTHNQKINKQKN